ncbi:MAG: hypothetical protein WCL19_09765 [Verrucomicrobiota bacterium]|jgi:hypothetical protein
MSSKVPGKPQSVEDPTHDEASTSAVFGMVQSLHKYSKDSWTSREEALWKKYLELLRDEELEALRSRGLDDEKAQRLVERVWVSRNPVSSALLVAHAPPNNLSSFVPAIRVFRNGRFEIHHRVLDCLDSHPVLAIPGEDTSADGDDRPYILQALDAIAEDLGLGYIGLGYVSPGVPEDAGRDRRIVDCGDAAHQLRLLLETEYLKGEPEDIEWLDVAKSRERFWRLLDTAFLLGEFMEHRRLLDELGAEEAMIRKITTPPGKGNRVNRAVVRMIEDYALENGFLPTPTKLGKWLGGVEPPEIGKPLQVDHPLWTADMKPITWKQFQNQVKKATEKMKR